MTHTILFAILTFTAPSLAARFDAIAHSGGKDPAFFGVEEFQKWSSENCKGCASTIGGLLRGIHDTKFLQDSVWHENTLHVSLTTDNLYGEIAAKSRLGFMWVLDKKSTFTFSPGPKEGEMTVQVEGLGWQPSTQGLDLYERAMKDSGLDPSTCRGEEGDEKCLEAEILAAGKYLSGNWKKIKKEDGKITRLLKTTYDNLILYNAAKAQGGKHAWHGIFYGMIVPEPARLTSFVFKDGTVYATMEYIQEPNYIQYHLTAKRNMFEEKLSAENAAKGKDAISVSFADKLARSAVAFGKMISYGLSEEYRNYLDKAQVGRAEVSAITNLFTWCKGTAVDKLPKCKGKTPGRVGWAPYPKQ